MLLMHHRKGYGYRLYNLKPRAKRLKGNGLSLPLKFQLRHSDSSAGSWLNAHVPEKRSVIGGARPTSFSGKAGLETPPNIP